MNIDKVTLTGADDNTSLQDLQQLSKKFPFVEWGILFSKSKEGGLRYPTQTKVREFGSLDANLSAHFCGWYSREVMEAQNFRLFDELPWFSRFQINYNFRQSKGWEVKWIIDWARNNPSKSIIFQANQSNDTAIGLILSVQPPSNIHFLYDSSGGRGADTAKVLPPFNNYTGYSGGLRPENVDRFCFEVNQYKLTDRVWIDMESGVRTDNYFDPEKCQEVLETCSYHINPAKPAPPL